MVKGKNKRNNVETSIEELVPPILLTFWTVAWKAIQIWSDVDFLLSVRGEHYLLMFQFALDYGSWVVLLTGVAWIALVKTKRIKTKFWPEMVFVVGLLTFMWSALLGVYATRSVPQVITAYGSVHLPPRCVASVDTTRLVNFRNDYDVAIICGIGDVGDSFIDKRVTISGRHTIHGQTFHVDNLYSQEMTEGSKKWLENNFLPPLWYKAVLIPKNVEMSAIHSLSDVTKYKGKIIAQGYYE